MARTSGHKIVSSKMDILVEHRDYLQTFVDETNQVLQLATSWLRDEKTTQIFTSSDMNKMIDDKLAFLVSADFSVGCQEAATEQELGATRSSPSAPKSTDQPLPAGHVHVSGVTAASDELKTILSQVNVMQEAMSSLSTSSKMLSEKQLAMEKLVESLSDKSSKVEQEKLREIENELKSIKEEHEKATIQQDKKITSFEKKLKDHKIENEKIKTQSQQFTKDLKNNVRDLNAKISSVLDKKTATNTQMGALEEKVESLKENLEELSTSFEKHSSLLEKCTRRNEETLKVLTSVQESESKILQELEEKLSALENSWSETTVENGKLCQDVETKCEGIGNINSVLYEMVCQVVTDRLVPLERLRDIFNGKLDARIENIKKLDNVCDQMADFLPNFSQVEQQTQRQAIGFSVRSVWGMGLSTTNETLILPKVTSNIGDHYDPKTGEFTAPLDGLYAVYFFVNTFKGDYSSFTIIKKPCSCEVTCIKCWCCAVELHGGMTDSTFGLVEMKANQKIFVKCWSEKNSISIRDSKFVCFKIF